MPTKAKRLKSLAISFILIISLFTAIIPIKEAEALPLIDEVFSFREQPDLAVQSPAATFTSADPCPNIGEDCIRTSLGARGHTFMFITINKNWLDGRRLNTTTRSNCNDGRVGIYDGGYDRSDDSMWANDIDGVILQGSGLLQTIRTGATWPAAPNSGENDSAIVDVSASVLSRVTLFFRCSETGVGGDSSWFGSVYIYDASSMNLLWWTEFGIGSVTMERTGTDTDYGYYGPLESSLDVCYPDSFTIENPSAYAEDGTPWVFTETRFYFFNASFVNFNLTRDEASIRFSPDGITNVTVTYDWYNDINGLLSVNDSPDFITGPSVARNGTGASYNSTTDDFWVIFPIWFTDNAPDAQYVDVYFACTGSGYLDTGEDFHIYNQGGLTEVEVEDNASFTVGAEWFEGCVFSTGSLRANQTFRKIQHYRYQFALRTYENVSGSWVPEDQFLQSQQNAGGGEEYAGPQDWDLDIALYAFDNSSETWVRINLLNMYFIDGDKDAANEWTALYSVVSNTTADLKSDSWNGFIEQEPAARVRTWVDVWINKINSSSVIGTRVQAYYYGMETNGYWLWTTWNPMLDNITQTIAFQDILDSSGNVVQAREYDLMKIGIDLSFTTDYGLASNPYRVCLEDVNTNEVLLQDRARLLEGVNTPIFIDVRIIDKPVGGLLGGLWIALQDLRDTLWAALSGVLGIAWEALAAQFPWLTTFVDDMYSLITSFSQFLTTIVSGLTTLLDFMAGQIGLFTTMVGVIGDTWALLTSWLDPFVANAGDWILLLLIVFGIIPFAANVSEGRIDKVRADIEIVWGFLRTIMDWTFRLAKMAIDIVLGVIPG